MAELRIRNVEEWIVEHHRHNARKKGITLGDELRNVLSDAALVRRIRLADDLDKQRIALKEKYGVFPSCVASIRETRESI